MKFQYQHQFGNFPVNGIAYAHAVAHQQVVLQFLRIFFSNQGSTQRSETGIDAVHHFLFAHNILHHVAVSTYTGDGFRSEFSFYFVAGKF